ncbi:MAG: type II secretion system protein [Gaiellaceae bacterium]
MDWIKCITNRLRRAARHEAGITLIETVLAIAIFGIVSASTIGVLTSATAADGNARQRSIALELAQQQVEYIRQLNYMNAGIVGGNPGGVVQAVQSKWVTGLRYTLTTRIKYVSDPIPASYVSSANYKQVRVIVARATDNKELARVQTYVSSPTRAFSGGLNNGVINVTTQDYWTHDLLGNVQIQLSKTWDGAFSAGDITDPTTGLPSLGQVTFQGLAETPASPTPGYYDVGAGLTGYTVLAEDQPPSDPTDPASAAHLSLARNGTTNTTIRLYHGCTITVHVIDGNNPPQLYTDGPATVTISSPRGSQQFQTSNGIVGPLTTLFGEPIVPGTDYQVDVATTTPYVRHAVATGLRVPINYTGGDYTSLLEVTLPAYVPPQIANVTVVVKRYSCGSSGTVQSSATVNIVWLEDPSDSNHNFTGTTNSSGIKVFTGVPLETYDIRASKTQSHTTRSGALPNTQITGDVSLCVLIS